MSDRPTPRFAADPALAPAPPMDARQLRATVERLRDLGFRAVQLDATATGLRPRDLGPSGRRDLVAALRRREAALAGLDLLLPPGVWLDPARVDAAVAAVAAAIELAADLGRRPVTIRLPDPPGTAGAARPAPAAAEPAPPSPAPGGLIVPPGVTAAAAPAPATTGASGDAAGAADPAAPAVAALLAVAERHGIELVDLGVAAAARGPAGPAPGLDVAACLAAGADPLVVAAADLERLAALRLADLTADGRRVPPGDPEGRADLGSIAGLVAVSPRPRPVVIDPRQWDDPWGGLVTTAVRWAEVSP